MNNDKLKNVEFIKNFNKITVIKACQEENVKKSNLYNMTTSKEKIERIKLNIDRKIKELYQDYENNSL